MNLLLVKMMFCICAGDKIIIFIDVYYKCTTKIATEKNPKPLYWIVIEIMSVMIKEGPVVLL